MFITVEKNQFWLALNKRKASMGNCLSKFNDKAFILYTPPLTAGHLKKVGSGIRKNSVKYFDRHTSKLWE